MDEDKAKIAALLAREYPFQNLTPEELLHLAGQLRLLSLEQDQKFLPNNQPERLFYVVYQGKVRSDIGRHSGKIYSSIFGPGNYFGEEALLGNQNVPDLITALEPTSLLTLDQEDFDLLIEQHPEVRLALSVTMQSRQMARQPRFSWIKPDEIVYFLGRKHVYFLIRSLIIPILFIIGSIPVIVIGLEGTILVLIIGLALLFLGVAGFIWNWFDWGNDYYIVTDQRVVWIEKILLLYDSRDEAPLYNVLAVDVYTTWFGKLVNFGDVTARTYTGRIPMRKADQPFVLGSYIEGLRKRSELIFREVEEQQMQEAIAEALRRRQMPSPEDLIPNVPPPPAFTPPKKKESATRVTGIRAWLKNFLKVRYEQNGVITYRKSWPLLVWKIWLPLVMFLIWTAGMIILLRQPNTDGTKMFWFSIMMVLLMGLLFWLWYNYTDWRNDIYQLTPTQIFDIEKKPLGSEIKKSADLENILSITHARKFLGVLLNYGDVVIKVGDTNFYFFYVFNPDRVHQDIANYQENLRQRKKKVQEAREKERMLNWLIAYNAESKKIS